MALILNGTDQYAEISLAHDITADFTMMADFKPRDLSGMSTIIALSSTNLTPATINADITAIGGVIGFQTGSTADIVSEPIPVGDMWQRVIVRASSGLVEVVVNGLFSLVEDIGDPQEGGSNKFIIGAGGIDVDTIGQFFCGEIGNVRAWAEVLPDEDVRALLDATSQRETDAVALDTLVISLDFNGDATGSNGKGDATLIGGPEVTMMNPLPEKAGGRHPKTQSPVRMFLGGNG